MLKSSILALLVVSIFTDDLKFIALIFLLAIVLNMIYNKNLFENIKRIKILFLLYLITSIFQLFYKQEGKIILKIYNFYLTQEGIIGFIKNYIRIINLILISWIINSQNIFKGRFKKYQNIIENVINLIPEVFTLVKKKMKLKYFFRYILKQITVKK